MSWSLTVPITDRADFDAAVDAAVPTGSNAETELGVKQVAFAKATIKGMAAVVVRGRISGNAGGHALQPDDGANFFDGISVAVSANE